jgi:hypothetical protein
MYISQAIFIGSSKYLTSIYIISQISSSKRSLNEPQEPLWTKSVPYLQLKKGLNNKYINREALQDKSLWGITYSNKINIRRG